MKSTRWLSLVARTVHLLNEKQTSRLICNPWSLIAKLTINCFGQVSSLLLNFLIVNTPIGHILTRFT